MNLVEDNLKKKKSPTIIHTSNSFFSVVLDKQRTCSNAAAAIVR
jgi:hypothetical protein